MYDINKHETAIIIPCKNEGIYVKQTLDFIKHHIGDRDTVFITCGLRVYPNTELARIAADQGLLDSNDDILQPAFYCSPEIDIARLYKLIAKADLPSGTVYFTDMDWPALPVMQKMSSMLGLTPPYWKYAKPVVRMRHMLNGHKHGV
jgi:hypothetical protein